jgi:LPXTG-motif cell wall-anchored protein
MARPAPEDYEEKHMRRFGLSAALLLCGLTLVLVDLATWLPIGAAPSIALAQPLPPRPTPRPTAKPQTDNGNSATPVASGRITGTVIDLTTGAPAPGISVAVGDVVVTSDANGNYDRSGLTPGVYTVALVLTAEQGVAAQEPIAVDLGAGATVVQHLFFRSAPLPQPTALPAGSAQPTPETLPTTGGEAQEGWQYLGMLLGMAALGLGVWMRRRASP